MGIQAFLLGLAVGMFGAGTVVAIYLGCAMLKLDDKYRKQMQEWLEQLRNHIPVEDFLDHRNI